MKICAISDLHGNLPESIPPFDLLLIAGDICPHFNSHQIMDAHLQLTWINTKFNEWLNLQAVVPFAICVWGEHDIAGNKYQNDVKLDKAMFLKNSSIPYKGLKIWGSPYTNGKYSLPGLVFQTSELILSEFWNMIPLDVDIILTHSPPQLILDDFNGSKSLKYHLNRTKFKYKVNHIFGHAHVHGKSASAQGFIDYYNVSIMNTNYHTIFPVTNINVETHSTLY